MSRQTEHPEEQGILTPPELNPLLNPVLAQNMGRWAEVYFTSPPEKREQAVLDLVRELEAQNSIRAEPVVAPPVTVPQQRTLEPMISSVSREPQVPRTLLPCQSCGRENPSSQRFCGMCGTLLPEAEQASPLPREQWHVADLHIQDQHVEDFPREESVRFQEEESQFAPPERDHRDLYERQRQRSNTNELSLFQTGREVDYGYDDSGEIMDAPSSGSYRIYIGLALAMIIGGLLYMAWRSAQAAPQASNLTPPAPEEVAKEPATPASSPTTSAKTNTPDRTPATSNQPAAATTARAPAGTHSAAEPTRPEPARNGRPSQVDRVATPKTALPEEKSLPEASAGNGAEELSLAQRYLNGTSGQRRDSAEAAKWLWKSIAKHNAEASLLLSDLYLRGDGVSKNCDQARVLLDAAAIRGVKDAGPRLRHLQAFGCQ